MAGENSSSVLPVGTVNTNEYSFNYSSNNTNTLDDKLKKGNVFDVAARYCGGVAGSILG